MGVSEIQPAGSPMRRNRDERVQVAMLFLKLGVLGFGGPAAHVALMRGEVVERRKWLSDAEFLDLLGASNLIPGPSSTELAMFLGYARVGPIGVVLAGICFILPAMLMVLALAWLYVRYGTTPALASILYGIKPVIIAVIAHALWGLGKSAATSIVLGGIGLAAMALYLAGASPIAVLLGAGAVVIAVRGAGRLAGRGMAGIVALPHVHFLQMASTAAAAVSLGTLFLTFLKIGAVVFGSGYVLLAFLHDDFVTRLHWLTDKQLIDAVAVGQFTPGPVFTTATFIGYVVGGVSGAVLATIAIFLPSFVFAAAVYPLVPRLRSSPFVRALLDGVNVGALGLMAAVTWQLARAAIVDVPTVLLLAAAGVLIFRWKVNSAWLILGGAVAGALHGLVT